MVEPSDEQKRAKRASNLLLGRLASGITGTLDYATEPALSKHYWQQIWQAKRDKYRPKHARIVAALELKWRLRARAEERKMWERDNSAQIDVRAATNLFERGAKQLTATLLPTTVLGMAAMTAAYRVNDALQIGLNFNTSLDIAELEPLLRRILRVRVLQDLLGLLKLADPVQHEITMRFVAQQFPTKDGRMIPDMRRLLKLQQTNQKLLQEGKHLSTQRITPVE